ncbi:MAG: hypothetical protein FJ312_06995 [SAR202 cluster bacterium]|nr:hypothetical protein [SAR202 cluster bacterium]
MLLVWDCGAASGIMDNIPYTAAMAEVVKQIPSAAEGVINPLWWALILGADLGGNATMIGASANVVVNAARSKGYHISFWHFFEYSLFCVIGTLAVSAVWVWLHYYLRRSGTAAARSRKVLYYRHRRPPLMSPETALRPEEKTA